MEREEWKFIGAALFLALIFRLVPAYFFIEEPLIPHDAAYYIEHAEFFGGGHPYDKAQSNGLPVVYGPASLAFYWFWVQAAGTGFFTLKLMPLVFDLLSIGLIYLIARKIGGKEPAKWASFSYAFFYISLLSAGALGNDDHLFMFFLLAGVFLALEGKFLPSGVLFGISAGFKPIPIALAPLVAYYVYRKAGLEKAVLFSAAAALVFLAILGPFYLESGARALVPYTGAVNFEYFGAGGIAPLNILRLSAAGVENAAYYLQNGEFLPFEQNSLKTTNKTAINDFFALVSKPLFYLSFVAFLAYAYFFRMKNAEMELVRNMVFLVFFALLSSKVSLELLFLYALPGLLVLVAVLERERLGKFGWGKNEVLGAGITVLAVILFSLFYRERVPDFAGAISMLVFVVLAGAGTWLMFRRSSFAAPICLFVLGCALFSVSAASPLYLLKPVLSMTVPDAAFGMETVHSYLIKTANLILSGVLVLVGSVWMLIKLHEKNKPYQQIPS